MHKERIQRLALDRFDIKEINCRLGNDGDRQKSNYLDVNENGHTSNKKVAYASDPFRDREADGINIIAYNDIFGSSSLPCPITYFGYGFLQKGFIMYATILSSAIVASVAPPWDYYDLKQSAETGTTGGNLYNFICRPW